MLGTLFPVRETGCRPWLNDLGASVSSAAAIGSMCGRRLVGSFWRSAAITSTASSFSRAGAGVFLLTVVRGRPAIGPRARSLRSFVTLATSAAGFALSEARSPPTRCPQGFSPDIGQSTGVGPGAIGNRASGWLDRRAPVGGALLTAKMEHGVGIRARGRRSQTYARRWAAFCLKPGSAGHWEGSGKRSSIGRATLEAGLHPSHDLSRSVDRLRIPGLLWRRHDVGASGR